MRAMQELKPDMDSIRARYKDDRQKQQEAIMKLYKERRVNPLAGFLPVLVQIPVFVTMYQVIRNHEETFPSFASGGLLWFIDLTRADPYFILPVLSASILFVAGGISSRDIDPGQRKMMRLMPIVFIAFIARFPAGLFVYWVTSNTVTLVQNYLIYHRDPYSRQNPQVSTAHLTDKSAREPTGEPKHASKPGKQSGRRKRRKKKKK
jgi:YidC/Oxa1 family membrane protein insertase